MPQDSFSPSEDPEKIRQEAHSAATSMARLLSDTFYKSDDLLQKIPESAPAKAELKAIRDNLFVQKNKAEAIVQQATTQATDPALASAAPAPAAVSAGLLSKNIEVGDTVHWYDGPRGYAPNKGEVLAVRPDAHEVRVETAAGERRRISLEAVVKVDRGLRQGPTPIPPQILQTLKTFQQDRKSLSPEEVATLASSGLLIGWRGHYALSEEGQQALGLLPSQRTASVPSVAAETVYEGFRKGREAKAGSLATDGKTVTFGGTPILKNEGGRVKASWGGKPSMAIAASVNSLALLAGIGSRPFTLQDGAAQVNGEQVGPETWVDLGDLPQQEPVKEPKQASTGLPKLLQRK